MVNADAASWYSGVATKAGSGVGERGLIGMPNRLDQALVRKMVQMKETMSNAQIAAAVGVSKTTVCVHTKGVERGLCGCGRSAGHRGWCHVMMARSPARRALLGRPGYNRKWSDEACALAVHLYEDGAPAIEIAFQVNRMLGRTDVTAHACEVMACKLGARRRKRSPNKKPYTRRGCRPTRPRALSFATAVIADACDIAFQALVEDDWRLEETAARARKLASEAERRAKFERQRAGLAKDRDFVPPRKKWVNPTARANQLALRSLDRPRTPVENVLPTARAVPTDKGVPFRMGSSLMPDPMREVRLRQIAESGRGRV